MSATRPDFGRKRTDQGRVAVVRIDPALLLVELDDAVLAAKQPHEFYDALQQLARRAARGREDDNFQAEAQRHAGREDGDAVNNPPRFKGRQGLGLETRRLLT
tara:strand:- start:92 stop:400 length:309 start_codon:yes stop_codon:yes gene_type:complete